MGIQIGTGSAADTLKKVMVGTGSAAVAVRKIMVGTGSAAIQVWADTVPMGMDKSGNQSGIARSVWTLVTGWGVRAGRPDTVIASNGLQVKAGTYDIDGLITYVSNDRRRWVRVYQNSTLLWEVSIGGTFVTSIPITGAGLSSVACGEGDLLTVEVMNDGGTDAVAGGTNTYLTATPV
ncbi:hypothetical protein [Rhodococcus sp. UNC363MFTsu5.1]|uniref:hypothetical protein n=1 Tax=Rhodococcus sp. UNC363MFTsu5.1 TaxID=1449069 RepID=UPI0004835307|nr:hypothetical protein [Rhodococcus sp. UNC363MFTsu5.1]